MKKIVFIVICIFVAQLASAQKSAVANSTAMDFAEKLIAPGERKFEALTKDVPEDLADIAETYKNVIAQQKDWFEEYRKKNKDKAVLPYHKNFQITKAEYDRLVTEFPKLKMKVRGVADLVITQNDSLLSFKGKGNFIMLDGLVLNTKSNEVIINEQVIPLKGECTEIDGIGKVKGYTWKFEYGTAEHAMKESSDYSMLQLDICTKDDDGSTVLAFANTYIELGIVMINGSIKGYLK